VARCAGVNVEWNAAVQTLTCTRTITVGIGVTLTIWAGDPAREEPGFPSSSIKGDDIYLRGVLLTDVEVESFSRSARAEVVLGSDGFPIR